MKDPLASSPTPYEILGVDRSAGPKEIDSGFKARLAKRGNPQALLRAKQALERPADRGLLDLFLYDPGMVRSVVPDPTSDPGLLELSNRASTARAWESQHKKRFPDQAVNHSLAVLWYWWAVHASDQLLEEEAEEPGDRISTVKEAWEAAIGAWVMVWADPSFWKQQSIVPAEVRDEVRSRCMDRIAGGLRGYADEARGRGREGLTELFRSLEHILATETSTATAVASAGLEGENGILACGILQLRRYDELDPLREGVRKALEERPQDQSLRELERALSPFSHIAARLERKQYQEALAEVEALPEEARVSKEVQALKAEALLELGLQQESLGHMEEALSFWEKALGCDPAPSLRDNLREAVENGCLTAAASLQKKKLNQAIKLLESGLKVVSSAKMEASLGDMLATRGIDTVNKAQKNADTGSLEGLNKLRRALKRGLKDLEKGAELGSDRALEQLETARDLVTQVEKASPQPEGMSDEVQALLEKAHAAHSKEDKVSAITHLREALKLVKEGTEAETLVKRDLSAVLTGIGVELANWAIGKVGGTAVSQKDIDEAKGIIAGAQTSLEEARSLDPSNEAAAKNLQELEKVRRSMEGTTVRRPVGAPLDFKEMFAPKPDERNLWVGFLTFILYLVPLGVAALAAPGPKWILRRPADWVQGVWAGSPLGSAGLTLGMGLSLIAVALVFLSGKKPVEYANHLLIKKWAAKKPAFKAMEMALLASYLSFVAATVIPWPPGTPTGAPAEEETPPTVEAELLSPPERGAASPSGNPPATEGSVEAKPETTARERAAEERLSESLRSLGREETPTDPSSSEGGVPDLAWLAGGDIPADSVSSWLSLVSDSGEGGSKDGEDRLREALDRSGREGRAAVSLILGWSAEAGGRAQEARETYHTILSFAGDTPYGLSAQLRLDLLEAKDKGEVEAAYFSLPDDPEIRIWAFLEQSWRWLPAQEAALLGLMEARADEWFIGVVEWIRGWSPLPDPYDYLFVIFVLCTLLVALKLPLIHTNAKGLATLLRPRRKADVNPLPGCVTLILGTLSAILLFFLFRRYEPRLILDQSRFFWAQDVAQRDLGIHILWLLTGVYLMFRTPLDVATGKTYILRGFFFCVPIAAITWFLGWPAWAMLFWAMLWFMTVAVQTFLSAFHS